jgi:hypothetical protein
MIGLGSVLALIGIFVLSLDIQMVGAFGETMGVDVASRVIYRQAHVAVHVFGTASSVAFGLFWKRSKMLAALALLAAVLCHGYGIVNVIGFTTTNRLSVAESRAAANSADWKRYEAQRQAIQDDIDWARKTVVHEDNPREKRLLHERIDKKLKELEAVQPPKPTAATVLADPQATWFSRITGTSAENWQLALAVPVAILVVVVEVLSLVFAFHLLVGAVDTLRGLRGDDEDRSRGSSGGGGVPKVRNTGDVSKDASNVSRTGAMLVGDFGRMASKRQRGQRLPMELATELAKAADWFVKGGSHWPSIRALARHFDVHPKTAGHYVLRAKQRQAHHRCPNSTAASPVVAQGRRGGERARANARTSPPPN